MVYLKDLPDTARATSRTMDLTVMRSRMKGQEVWPVFSLAFSGANSGLTLGAHPGGHRWRPLRAGEPRVRRMPWLATPVAPVPGGAGYLTAALREPQSRLAEPGRLYSTGRRPPILTGSSTSTFCLTYRLSPDGPTPEGAWLVITVSRGAWE